MSTEYKKPLIMDESGVISASLGAKLREPKLIPVIIIISQPVVALQIQGLKGLIILHAVLLIYHLQGTLSLFS